WAFFGNLFVPLSGTVQQIARWTPMYGYAGLVRWPQMQGQPANGTFADPMWSLILNWMVWAVLFAGAAIWANHRGRARQ
ncbi:MAG: ABC transporter permease, partial [Micrococcales bacterium]|nr:ABC transporter permease [Micrococcales bacterium]